MKTEGPAALTPPLGPIDISSPLPPLQHSLISRTGNPNHSPQQHQLSFHSEHQYTVTMAADSPRQCKRPFQPNITSYFLHSTDSHIHEYPPPRPRSNSGPSSPCSSSVQASLLSSSMRFRKSLPEGYKTNAFFNWSSTLEDERALLASCSKNIAARRGGTSSGTGLEELTPYCGLLQIGARTDPPLLSRACKLPLLTFPDFDFRSSRSNSNSSSASSTSSLDSSRLAPSTAKRRFDERDAGQAPCYSLWDDTAPEDLPPPSPRSYPFCHFHMRPIASPRSRRRYASGLGGEDCVMEDPESGDIDMMDTMGSGGGELPVANFFRTAEWGRGCDVLMEDV